MKIQTKLYESVFIQIWLLALSALIMAAGILLLTDLKYYRCVLTKGLGAACNFFADEEGKIYAVVSIDCETEFCYTRYFESFTCPDNTWHKVRPNSGYKLENYTIYLDIYHKEGNESVLVETVHDSSYSQTFYDIEYATGLEIKPRIEDVRIRYPSWRIYVPVLLFLLSVPVAGLSFVTICIRIYSLRKQNKEAETPVAGK